MIKYLEHRVYIDHISLGCVIISVIRLQEAHQIKSLRSPTLEDSNKLYSLTIVVDNDFIFSIYIGMTHFRK